MLLADEPLHPGWYGVIGGLVGAAGTAATQVILTLHRGRRETTRDTVKDYQKITDDLVKRMNAAEANERACQASLTKVLVEQEKLRGQLALLQSALRRYQTRTGDEPPATVAATMIIADLKGVIRTVTPQVWPLLGWKPADLLGQNVEVLIPERDRLKHQEGLRRVAESQIPPWAEKTIEVHALHKSGREIPVSVTLFGWSEDDSEFLISAEVRRRYDVPPDAPA